MILLLFLFGLALGAESPSGEPEVKLQRGNCPMFWFNFNGRCYKYVASQMTWADAEVNCLSQGANLVSIHSRDEDDFVRALVKNFDPAEGPTWIGLSDTHKEGTWMWSDGCPVKFTYWGPSQPGGGAGPEHCVMHKYESDQQWHDGECQWTLPSVCATRINCP